MFILETELLQIGYLQGGPEDGFPLLLLHGWPDDANAWAGVTPALEAAGYRWFAPSLRGFGPTQFRWPDTIRDGSSAAIAQDALDFADALGLSQYAIIGHDWGGRAAYAMAALAPEQVAAITVLAIGYTPRGRYKVPSYDQCQRWWYQWLMTSDAGVAKITADPIGFARSQWDKWSPVGWYEEADFEVAAASFRNPDWLAVTFNGYRHRWQHELLDPRYMAQRARIDATEQLTVPTLMVQGDEDYCDPPIESEGQGRWFTAGYRRMVLEGVGHFPAREAASIVARSAVEHFDWAFGRSRSSEGLVRPALLRVNFG